MIASVGFQ